MDLILRGEINNYMNLKTTYKTLIWIGIILFIAGVVGDGNSIVYLRQGAVLGPILFVIGTIIWIPIRIKKPILHAFNSDQYKSSADALFAFIINNFTQEFWAFCIAFGMLLVIGGGYSMKSSPGFQAAIDKIQYDEELIKRIGEFRETGSLVGGSTSPTEVKIDFSAYGTREGARVNIELKKEDGEWKIIDLKYD
ncbi:MAG: hypothetical protein ACJA2S_004824 [Cyclobacteriaceae bacterium]|jgi:hypothetical protein